MLGFWSSKTLPEIDVALISRAFAEAPQTLTERHTLLGGRDMARPATGKIVCSCFSIGEKNITEAIEKQGCSTVAELGCRLKCGTNCGSCIPELKALLACTVRQTTIS